MESTVDWIEGSKNPEISVLCACRFVFQFVGRASAKYPVSVNLPALIPCLGSLSLGEPNLTY